MHSIQVVETFVKNWISAKMKFMGAVLLWACYTPRFTQKQNQSQDISIRSMVKHIAVVTRTRQAEKSRVNINLVLCAEWNCAEVKLTKNSLVNLNHFWLRLLNTYLTTVSKYGRTNDISIFRPKYLWLSGFLRIPCWLT